MPSLLVYGKLTLLNMMFKLKQSDRNHPFDCTLEEGGKYDKVCYRDQHSTLRYDMGQNAE